MGQNMEILLNSTTQIQQADKEVTIKTELNVPQDIDISNIYKTVDFQKVSCTAKVLNTDEPVWVSGGKTKQDTTISDSSGCIRLTVWEEYINQLEEDTSYHFSGVTVRTFKSKNFLSSSKDSFTFKKIDDIGNVEYPEDPSSNISISINKIDNAYIAGIENLDYYSGCIQCFAKVDKDQDDEDIAICSKCDCMFQMKHSTTEAMATLLIKSTNASNSDPPLPFRALRYCTAR